MSNELSKKINLDCDTRSNKGRKIIVIKHSSYAQFTKLIDTAAHTFSFILKLSTGGPMPLWPCGTPGVFNFSNENNTSLKRKF